MLCLRQLQLEVLTISSVVSTSSCSWRKHSMRIKSLAVATTTMFLAAAGQSLTSCIVAVLLLQERHHLCGEGPPRHHPGGARAGVPAHGGWQAGAALQVCCYGLLSSFLMEQPPLRGGCASVQSAFISRTWPVHCGTRMTVALHGWR